MRRPVVFLFLFYAFGIILEYRLMLGLPYLFIFAALFFGACFTFRNSGFVKDRRKRFRNAALFVSVTMLGSVCFYLAENHKDPLETEVGELWTAEGRIITVQVKDDNYRQLLITSEGGRKRLVQVQGPMGAPQEYIGKWAVVRGKVTLPSGQRNPGLFDYQLYLKTKGVRVILQSSSGQITLRQAHSSILFSSLARMKYGFLDRLGQEMKPRAFGLMVGMLFGDCSFIDDDIYESFQKNGVAHILSVSGIHVAIVYLFVSRLLGGRKTRSFYAVAALLMLLYAALSEFSPCVVRAVVMILIHMFSKVSYRRYDFTSCTSVSALGMLIYNPFYLFNTGFQLSYLAVFCLASMLPWMDRRLTILAENGASELLTEALRYLAPLLIIQLSMAPVTAYLFNYFSIASFFVNPPVIGISGIIIPLGIFLMPLSLLGGVIFGVGAQAAELLIDLMLWSNQVFFLPGVGFFNAVSPPVFALLAFYGFLFFLSSEFFRVLFQRKRWRTIKLYCCAILILSLLLSFAADKGYDGAALVFLDVGQGDCLYIHTPEGKSIFIDGGGNHDYKVGEKILLPYLLKKRVSTVDLALVTHLHADHYLGIQELSGKMKIGKLGVFEANRLREGEIIEDTGLKSDSMLYLAEGDTIRVGKEVRIEVLYPERQPEEVYEQLLQEEQDENKSSLIMKVYYRDLTILMTGDLGTDGEAEIMERYREEPEALRADILKVGHHGSRYSTSDAFLEAVDPKVAVFQVGKNNFGHPHPTIIEKCSKKGIMIYRNDRNGAVIFENEGQAWHIKVMLPKSMHIKE